MRLTEESLHQRGTIQHFKLLQ